MPLPTTPLEAAAAAALGGVPVQPPAFKTQVVEAKPRADAGVVRVGSEARTAFAAQLVAGAIGRAKPVAVGNPTFDGLPPALVARRATVAAARRRLAALAAHITAEQAALTTVLDDLADDEESLKAAELFDVTTARKFLTDLSQLITALSAPAAAADAAPASPAKPKKKTK